MVQLNIDCPGNRSGEIRNACELQIIGPRTAIDDRAGSRHVHNLGVKTGEIQCRSGGHIDAAVERQRVSGTELDLSRVERHLPLREALAAEGKNAGAALY